MVRIVAWEVLYMNPVIPVSRTGRTLTNRRHDGHRLTGIDGQGSLTALVGPIVNMRSIQVVVSRGQCWRCLKSKLKMSRSQPHKLGCVSSTLSDFPVRSFEFRCLVPN